MTLEPISFVLGVIIGLLLAVIEILTLRHAADLKKEVQQFFSKKASVVDMSEPLDNVQI